MFIGLVQELGVSQAISPVNQRNSSDFAHGRGAIAHTKATWLGERPRPGTDTHGTTICTGSVRRGHGPPVSRSISRVLSRATIHLGRPSPIASSGLPGSGADHAFGPLFGLAPGGVYLAGAVARPRGALLPHPFTLTNRIRQHLDVGRTRRRFAFCCTCRGFSPPRGYLAPCPVEPGLSSRRERRAVA